MEVGYEFVDTLCLSLWIELEHSVYGPLLISFISCSFGSWVPADKVKEEVDEEMPDATNVKEEKPDSLVRERAVGAGMHFQCFCS